MPNKQHFGAGGGCSAVGLTSAGGFGAGGSWTSGALVA